ncbi:hypothetical protein ACM9HF_06990 [Colwellia sp. RE-S-Sl-9]
MKADPILGARADGIVTGPVGKSFTVPEEQFAYRIEFTGEYKTRIREGIQYEVPVYTETQVNVITLDNTGTAILEIKTGASSKLTINQAVEYQMALDGCGTVCGPKSNDLQLFSNGNKAPTVGYIIRDTEL